LRELQRERNQFAETILTAVYPTSDGERAIVLVPLTAVKLPPVDSTFSLAQLRETLPSYCPLLTRRDLPSGERRGTWQTYAEVILCDGQGDVFETTVIDCLAGVTKPQGGDGPVIATGDEMEWLLSAVSPRLGEDHRYWICLEADGICIGGVVWGARTGEAQRLSPQVQELTALATGCWMLPPSVLKRSARSSP
jgi:hypothetical protein